MRPLILFSPRNVSYQSPKITIVRRFTTDTSKADTINSLKDVLNKFIERDDKVVPEQFKNIWGNETIIEPHPGNKLKLSNGLWFRGVPDQSFRLIPSVFRNYNQDNKIKVIDETSLYQHSCLLLSDSYSTHKTVFSWLTMMQHYGAPTRLLDWSENILTALFFTIIGKSEEDNKPGAIWVLNPTRLNELTKFKFETSGIATPDDLSVVMRSEIATTGHIGHLLKKKAIREHDDLISNFDISRISPDSEELKILQERLNKPIAVYPSRNNSRLQAQSGTFTLHGGKKYLSESLSKGVQNEDKVSLKDEKKKADKDQKELQAIPFYPEKTLEELNEEQSTTEKFLKKYLIPPDAKKAIRNELLFLGVNERTQFVGLENQFGLLKTQWSFFKQPSKPTQSVEQSDVPNLLPEVPSTESKSFKSK